MRPSACDIISIRDEVCERLKTHTEPVFERIKFPCCGRKDATK